MQITFSPYRGDDTLTLERQGDTLIVDGVATDFSGLAEGGSLSALEIAGAWPAADVTRANGVLQIAIRLPHGANAGPEACFPDPVVLQDGQIWTRPA